MYNCDLSFRNGMQPNETLLHSSIPVRQFESIEVGRT